MNRHTYARTSKLVPAALAACLLWPATGRTATIDAESCSQPHVQGAVDSAMDGDLVLVPPGRCRWTSPVFTNGTAVTIQGSGIDRTTIVDGTGNDWQQSPFWAEGEEGRPFRITGFTLTGDNDYYGVITIRGQCRNFRIDNIKFLDLPERCINISGYSYGLVDHCVFENTAQPLAANGDTNAAWERPLTLGTENAVYVEDCLFIRDDGNAAIDAHDGGRFVFRYNTLYNAHVHAHGCCNTTRGVFSFEIYENTIIVDERMVGDPTMWAGVAMRGGTGVIFNNEMIGPFYHPILVVNYRTCHEATHDACQEEFDRCDGDSQYDGNEDSTGYPCRDQIGRSTDTGQFTPQALEPLYQWNNTLNGNPVVVEINDISSYFTCENPSMRDHIKSGRDYFDETERPGYQPYVYPHPLNQSGPTCQNQGYLCCDECTEGTAQPGFDGDCAGQICCEECVPTSGSTKGCGCRVGSLAKSASQPFSARWGLLLFLMMLTVFTAIRQR